MAFAVDAGRIALVIGNSNYQSAPLKNPVNDATDMAAVLRSLRFQVTLQTDADQRAMEGAIRRFGNNLNIIILDACRNNPFARSFRSADQGLAKMDAPAGSILAYATSPGSVAADGGGRNGLYTAMLLKHMQQPGIELARVFRRVRVDVMNASNRSQVPWESSSLTGDFYFTPGRGIAVKGAAPTQTVPPLASIRPETVAPKIVGRDGTFTAYANGAVVDRSTGLMWASKDNGNRVNWRQAEEYCQNFRGAGFTDWRLPTIHELKSLVDKSENSTYRVLPVRFSE
jgi:hypothetical protein